MAILFDRSQPESIVFPVGNISVSFPNTFAIKFKLNSLPSVAGSYYSFWGSGVGSSTYKQSLSLRVSTGDKANVYINDTSPAGTNLFSTESIVLGQWYTLIYVARGLADRSMWLNKTEVTNSTFRAPSPETQGFGCRYGGGTKWESLDGVISNFDIWDYGFIASDVSNYVDGLHPLSFKTKPKYSWDFRDNDPTVKIIDRMGNFHIVGTDQGTPSKEESILQTRNCFMQGCG